MQVRFNERRRGLGCILMKGGMDSVRFSERRCGLPQCNTFFFFFPLIKM